MSPPPAYSPGARDDTEVLSRGIAPNRAGAQDVVWEAPQGETSTAGHMGEPIPMQTGDRGHIQFGPQPNTVPETNAAPEPGKQPPSKGGGAPILLVTSVQPEAPDTLMEALRSASIIEEHRTLMGTVVERIQSAKSGLTEACTSLLIGFEVRNAIYAKGMS